MGQCACKGPTSLPGKKKSSGKLSKTQMLDLLNTTKFSEEEITEWHAAFMKAFPSGRITYDLYQELVLKAVFRKGPENVDGMGSQVMHHLDLSFRQYDLDGDQTISFREFLVGMSISTKGTLEEKIYWAFAMYDIDKDGIISQDEMKEILMISEKAYDNSRSKEDIEKLVRFMFTYLDADHNGVISVQEFILGLKTKPELLEFFTGGPNVLSTVGVDELKGRSAMRTLPQRTVSFTSFNK